MSTTSELFLNEVPENLAVLKNETPKISENVKTKKVVKAKKTQEELNRIKEERRIQKEKDNTYFEKVTGYKIPTKVLKCDPKKKYIIATFIPNKSVKWLYDSGSFGYCYGIYNGYMNLNELDININFNIIMFEVNDKCIIKTENEQEDGTIKVTEDIVKLDDKDRFTPFNCIRMSGKSLNKLYANNEDKDIKTPDCIYRDLINLDYGNDSIPTIDIESLMECIYERS